MTSRIQRMAKQMAMIEAIALKEFWSVMEECAGHLRAMDPIQRKLFTANVVLELHEAQGGRCALCGEELRLGAHHVDHRIAFRWGGGNERSNLQLAHPRCNQRKGDDVDAYALLEYLEDRAANL